ncbi:DUF1003 domain-containing protein [Taibaiella koreensis]|uniref:DUF1003 domain-containing protein n=1 Tax=Taibaiella koreensis TaxID=1268548 RepID=UPI000E59BB57|nr:DUF1003 domain-containing protein [Taibaiella koreensis]
METFKSDLSGKEFPLSERVSGDLIHGHLMQKIQEQKPAFSEDSCLAASELNSYKLQYLSDHLTQEIGDLGELEKTVLDSIGNRTTLSAITEEEDRSATLGQRVADKVAAFGGSWRFIISFSVILVLWIIANSVVLANKGFDPYPFILLNLILSCLAALQAPVIMMSQNRQEEKDRARAKSDYMINLKSELEIRMLHEKLDHLMLRQQQDIIEMQRDQIEQMDQLIERLEQNHKNTGNAG